MRVFLWGGRVRGETDASPIVFCLAFLAYSPQPVVPPPYFNAKGLVGSKDSQWQRRLGLGLEIPPLLSPPTFPLPSCSFSLALMGVCLAVSLLSLCI